MRTSIIIPVFDNVHRVNDLVLSLKNHTDFSLVDQVIISDDTNQPCVFDRLEAMVREAGEPFTLMRTPENLGFGGNCNASYDRVAGEVAIIINSDVVVPPGWLERMLAPFADADIALASPLSNRADAQSIFYGPGTDWREIDALLSRRQPAYPDAAKSSGFMLAVHKDRVRLVDGKLFDTVTYGRGYWEDTDLHFRTLADGRRSVIIDNLYVKHIGFQSFSAEAEESIALSQINERKFRRRWHVTADELAPGRVIDAFDTIRSRQDRRFLWRETKHLDLLFVLPLTNASYTSGGANVVFDIVDHLIDKGYKVAVFAPQSDINESFFYSRGFMPFTEIADLFRMVKTVGQVWATSGPSLETARIVANRYRQPLYLFGQGPESYFGDGANAGRILRNLSLLDGVIAVSSYLENYFGALGLPCVARIDLGPSRFKFFEMPGRRQPRAIAVHVSGHLNKGPSLAVTFGVLAQQRGFDVFYFGAGANDPAIPKTALGSLGWQKMRELFSRVSFLVDLSYFEGLGLIAIEAAFCGCIPVFTKKGGIDALFEDMENALLIPDHTAMPAIIERMASLDSDQISRMSRHAAGLVDQVGHEKAMEQIQAVIDASRQHREVPETQLVFACASRARPLDKTAEMAMRIALLDDYGLPPLPLAADLAPVSVRQPPLLGHVDCLTVTADTIAISGWCMAEGAVAPTVVAVLIGGYVAAMQQPQVWRPDVLNAYGVTKEEPVGYSIEVNKEDFIGLLCTQTGYDAAVQWAWEEADIKLMMLFDDGWKRFDLDDAARCQRIVVRLSTACPGTNGEALVLAAYAAADGFDVMLFQDGLHGSGPLPPWTRVPAGQGHPPLPSDIAVTLDGLPDREATLRLARLTGGAVAGWPPEGGAGWIRIGRVGQFHAALAEMKALPNRTLRRLNRALRLPRQDRAREDGASSWQVPLSELLDVALIHNIAALDAAGLPFLASWESLTKPAQGRALKYHLEQCHVDEAQFLLGGWCMCEEQEPPQLVALIVGERVCAATFASVIRDDVRRHFGLESLAPCGFHLNFDVSGLLRAVAAVFGEDQPARDWWNLGPFHVGFLVDGSWQRIPVPNPRAKPCEAEAGDRGTGSREEPRLMLQITTGAASPEPVGAGC